MSKFLKIIVNTVVICAILVAGALLIPPLAKVNTIMVDDANMDTNLPLGSVTYSKSVGLADVGVGDKIIFKESTKTYEYQVKDMDATAGTYMVVDAKDSKAQEETITLNKTVLKPIFTIPFIAYAAMALQTTEGLIMVGLGVVFLVILFILSELWKKDKETYDDEDDDDEDDDDEDEGNEKDADDDEEEELKPALKKTVKPIAKEEEKSEFDLASESLMQESMRGLAQEVQQAKTNAAEEISFEEEVEEISVEEKTPEPSIKKVLTNPVPKQIEETLEEQLEKILAAPTAEELIAKAKETGSEPVILEDKDAKITLLDYSDIL